METEKLYEVVGTCCRTQISQEKEEMYDYVRDAVVRWVCENYDDDQIEDIKEDGLSDQVKHYIGEFNKQKGSVKSSKEWEMLEDAYRIFREGLNPKESRIAKEWRGLRPEQIMHCAMESFGKKMIRSWNQGRGDTYFVEVAVGEAIEGAMEAGAFGAYGKEQFEDKKTIYDKCKNEKDFCRYFKMICHNKYCDAAKKAIKDRLRNESYEVFLEKGIEVGETEGGSEAEGMESLFASKADEWTKELMSMLRLVLRQVATGPLPDYDDAPGVYRNVGGAFAKYVPFLLEDFVKKEERFELWTFDEKDAPKDRLRRPSVRKNASQAASQMYPIIENHVARSAAVMFAKIINGSLESVDNNYNWTEDFYRRILKYEKEHGRVIYRDVINSDETMRKNAYEIHTAALQKCKEILEKRLTKTECSTPTDRLLLENLNQLLN